jgi:hypothetical protein
MGMKTVSKFVLHTLISIPLTPFHRTYTCFRLSLGI